MADLAVLRTAKQAMGEDLITQEDFNEIKVAFLRAQQIKAGLDAGFIREEDYMQARDSFLNSLDFSTGAPQQGPGLGYGAAPLAPTRPPPGAAPVSHPVKTNGSRSTTPNLAQMVRAPMATAPPAPPSLLGSGGSSVMAAAAAAHGLASGGPSADYEQPEPAEFDGRPGTVPIPQDLPKLGRTGLAAGKKSMSGIAVNEQCINLFNHIKTKSAFKWISFKVDAAGTQVVPDRLGHPSSTYDQFVAAALPENQCRYAVYDYAYENSDTKQTNQKLVFVQWAPETSPTKQKMMYASTKEFLKGFLDGLGAELQADSMSEMAEELLRERVGHNMTRK
mmetsp:Transcript_2982/g.5112  ORF Transcript_2982/g.5112 Transcript_2982/m.5112 type:complete len:334 (-) Transcript_2982:1741-2742(-)